MLYTATDHVIYRETNKQELAFQTTGDWIACALSETIQLTTMCIGIMTNIHVTEIKSKYKSILILYKLHV